MYVAGESCRRYLLVYGAVCVTGLGLWLVMPSMHMLAAVCLQMLIGH